MSTVKVQKTSNYKELVSSEIKKCLFTYIFHLVLLYCVAKGVRFLARTRDARDSGAIYYAAKRKRFLARTRDARAFPSNFAFLLSQPSHKRAVACDKFS